MHREISFLFGRTQCSIVTFNRGEGKQWIFNTGVTGEMILHIPLIHHCVPMYLRQEAHTGRCFSRIYWWQMCLLVICENTDKKNAEFISQTYFYPCDLNQNHHINQKQVLPSLKSSFVNESKNRHDVGSWLMPCNCNCFLSYNWMPCFMLGL